jgi:hypothetical protein
MDGEATIAVDMSGIASTGEVSAGREMLDGLLLEGPGISTSDPTFAVLAVCAALAAIGDSPHPLRLLEAFEAVCQGYRDAFAR